MKFLHTNVIKYFSTYLRADGLGFMGHEWVFMKQLRIVYSELRQVKD